MDVLGLLICGIAIGMALGWLWRDRFHRSASHVDPHFDLLRNALDKLAQQVHSGELERAKSHAALAEQVFAMQQTNYHLSTSTQRLATALHSPQIRGRWGEVQLERVAELSGMRNYCDFDTQVSGTTDDARVRPDMVIRLSNGRNIVVDAKVPCTAYLEAIELLDDEEQSGYLRHHAHQVRQHVISLSSKEYTKAFYPSPEFVVMFVPADPFLDAALSVDPGLLDFAFSRNIIIATPGTLLALLKTVALSWRSEDINTKAEEVLQLGTQLLTRLTRMATHFNALGAQLNKTVDAFNATVGSLESRVLVSARKLNEITNNNVSEQLEIQPLTAQTRKMYPPNNQETEP